MTTIDVYDAVSRLLELTARAATGERFLIACPGGAVVVLIGAAELECLERASRIALRLVLACGQDSDPRRQVEPQETHPTMTAFGLWQDAQELAALLGQPDPADEESAGGQA